MFPHCVRQEPEWTPEPEQDCSVVRRGEVVNRAHQHLPEAIALCPATDAGHAVSRKHRRAVVEHQPIPERQLPEFAIILDRVSSDHLRLGPEAVVLGKKRVENQVGVIARDSR